MSKFCINCGAELTDTAKFCNKCGANQTEVTSAEPVAPVLQEQPVPVSAAVQPEQAIISDQPQYIPPAQQNAEMGKSPSKLIPIILIIIIALCLAFDGILLFTDWIFA